MNRKQMKKDIQNMKQVQLYKVIKKESRQKKKKIKMVKKKEMKKIMGRKERKVKMGEM